MAKERFNKWIEDTIKLKLETFYTTANTVRANFENILNFFNNRNTNANAKSFNAKIKLFRANLRGGTDTSFFSLAYVCFLLNSLKNYADPEKLYQERYAIERTNAWIDSFRSLLNRFDTTITSWIGFNFLAFIVIGLRKFDNSK